MIGKYLGDATGAVRKSRLLQELRVRPQHHYLFPAESRDRDQFVERVRLGVTVSNRGKRRPESRSKVVEAFDRSTRVVERELVDPGLFGSHRCDLVRTFVDHFDAQALQYGQHLAQRERITRDVQPETVSTRSVDRSGQPWTYFSGREALEHRHVLGGSDSVEILLVCHRNSLGEPSTPAPLVVVRSIQNESFVPRQARVDDEVPNLPCLSRRREVRAAADCGREMYDGQRGFRDSTGELDIVSTECVGEYRLGRCSDRRTEFLSRNEEQSRQLLISPCRRGTSHRLQEQMDRCAAVHGSEFVQRVRDSGRLGRQEHCDRNRLNHCQHRLSDKRIDGGS